MKYSIDFFLIYFSEYVANVSSFLSASSIATISSSRQVFFKRKKKFSHFIQKNKNDFTNREPNENANRKINKRSFVPIKTKQIDSDRSVRAGKRSKHGAGIR